MNPTMADLEKYITKADPNKGTGFITHVAYLNLMGSLCIDDKEDQEDQLREAFMVFDKNGDGFLSSSELQYAMTSLGERLSSEELHGLMSEADLDGDGQLNYEEFINVMLSRYFRDWSTTSFVSTGFYQYK